MRGAPPFAMTRRDMRTADQPIRISLIAPDGRMGKAIAAAAAEDAGFAIDQDHGDVLVDFSAPAALQASLDRAIAAGMSRSWSARPGSSPSITRRSTRPHEGRGDARAQHLARHQPAARPGRAGGGAARARMGHRDPRDAPSPQGRRAVGHRADARPSGGEGPRHDPRSSAASTGSASIRTRASRARSASPRCAADRSPASMS